MTSTKSDDPAIYPPTAPYAFPRVPVGRRQLMNSVNSEESDRLTSNNINTVHYAAGDGFTSLPSPHICVEIEVFCNASTGGTIHSNSVDLESKLILSNLLGSVTAKAYTDLVQESQSTVAFSKVTNILDGSDAAAHGVDTFECHDLRDGLGILGEFLLKIFQVVVLENDTLGSRVAHALNHGSMVHLVGEDDTPGELGAKGGEGCIIGDVAGGEY